MRFGGILVYLRYVDDLSLFADHPEPLRRARHRIEAELESLRLRLHPVKSQLRRSRVGGAFVGFLVMPGRVRVRNHNLRKGRRRLRVHHREVRAGLLTPERARLSLQRWNAHLAHGQTWRLRRRLFALLPYAEGLSS
jgi:RNA-directed DNA polymerase